MASNSHSTHSPHASNAPMAQGIRSGPGRSGRRSGAGRHLAPTLESPSSRLADGFIALIKLSITPLIFLVVSTGVAQVGDMRKVGRIGLKALIYFEIITTIALVIGATVGNLVHFGASVQRPSASPGGNCGQGFMEHPKRSRSRHSCSGSCLENLFGSFVHDNVLQVLVIALLVGAAMVRLGETGMIIRKGLERATSLVFGIVNIIVLAAPLGAFGALGFTVGKFGVGTLYALGMFMLTAWASRWHSSA